MDLSLEFHVPAPNTHVDYVLSADDEYPVWNSAARAQADSLVWKLDTPPMGTRSYPASVSTTLDATTITLYRGPFAVIRMCFNSAQAGVGRTTLQAQVWSAPSLFLLPKQTVLRRQLRGLVNDLTQRARWLGEAPDTAFVPPVALSLLGPPAARTASLEQLHRVSRELEGGVLAVESATSCCLLDLERRRFARAAASADLHQLVEFGRWQSFDDVICDKDDVVLVPTGGAARIRIRACGAVTV